LPVFECLPGVVVHHCVGGCFGLHVVIDVVILVVG
jgi:hypothetical protein